MKITMNETVATVTYCYRRGREYEVPDAEGAALVRAGQASSDDPAAAAATRQHRQRMDKPPSTPLEAPVRAAPKVVTHDLHPAEQPDQTPADIERAGRTRGPVETVPPTDPAALDPENPLVPKAAPAAAATKPAGQRN